MTEIEEKININYSGSNNIKLNLKKIKLYKFYIT